MDPEAAAQQERFDEQLKAMQKKSEGLVAFSGLHSATGHFLTQLVFLCFSPLLNDVLLFAWQASLSYLAVARCDCCNVQATSR